MSANVDIRVKYELMPDDTIQHWSGVTLYRIRCVTAFGIIAARSLGGYVQSEANLSQSGDAWVSGNARVSGDARVYGNAWVYGNAQVSGDAWVSGDASILWVSKVGSEQGTLTAYKDKAGRLIVTRGCFIGTDEAFLAAVEETHGASSKIGREYALLIEFARLRLADVQP